MKFCIPCERDVEESRKIGVGTLILVLVTWGFWILAIIFYEKRCPICNCTNLRDNKYKGDSGGSL